MTRIVIYILIGFAVWPMEVLACVPMEVPYGRYCARVTPQQCALEWRKAWPTIVLGRVKEAYIDPNFIQRAPAWGGNTRYSYAEIEVIDTVKGKAITLYITRAAEGGCGAQGPFVAGETSLFGLSDFPIEGPAFFPGHKQTPAQARQLMPTIMYVSAYRLPDRFKTDEMLELLRKQMKE